MVEQWNDAQRRKKKQQAAAQGAEFYGSGKKRVTFLPTLSRKKRGKGWGTHTVFIDPALLIRSCWIDTGRAKATADPSTTFGAKARQTPLRMTVC
jgi:hypothetical protein